MQMHISSSLHIRNLSKLFIHPWPFIVTSSSSPRGDHNEHPWVPAAGYSMFVLIRLALLGLQTSQPTQSVPQKRNSICWSSRHLAQLVTEDQAQGFFILLGSLLGPAASSNNTATDG